MDENFLNEYRCSCGKLLFKGNLRDCRVEIKCRRCGEIKTIDFCNGVQVENKLCNFPADED